MVARLHLNTFAIVGLLVAWTDSFSHHAHTSRVHSSSIGMVSLVEQQQQQQHHHQQQQHHRSYPNHHERPHLSLPTILPNHVRSNTVLIDNYSDTSRREFDLDTDLAVRNMLQGQVEWLQQELDEQKLRRDEELRLQQEEFQHRRDQLWDEGCKQLEEERHEFDDNLATQNMEHRLDVAARYGRMQHECQEHEKELDMVNHQLTQGKEQMLKMQCDLVCLMTQIKLAQQQLTTVHEERHSDRTERQQQLQLERQNADDEVACAIKEGRAQQVSTAQVYRQELQASENVLREQMDLIREAKFDCRDLDIRIAQMEEDRNSLYKVTLTMMNLVMRRTWTVVSTLVGIVLGMLHTHIWQHPVVQQRIEYVREKARQRIPMEPMQSSMEAVLQLGWKATCVACRQLSLGMQRLWQHPRTQQSKQSLKQWISTKVLPQVRSILQWLFEGVCQIFVVVLKTGRDQWKNNAGPRSWIEKERLRAHGQQLRQLVAAGRKQVLRLAKQRLQPLIQQKPLPEQRPVSS